MSTHGDGGKGSGRRKEDASKVRDNWDLIFNKKDGKDMEQGQELTIVMSSVGTGKSTFMYEPQDLSEDYERSEDDGYEICHRCNGSGEGMYDGSVCGFCKGTGEEPVERDRDDFDFPEDDYDD